MRNKRKAVILYNYLQLSTNFLQENATVPVRRTRRWWVRDIFQERESQGDGENLIRQMMITDSEGFYNYARMTKTQFDSLLNLVAPHLSKLSIRKPICAKERLLVTLRFLATGDSYGSLSFAFRMGKMTVCYIIRETTELIWLLLNGKYIPAPTKESLREVAKIFWLKTNFPHCVGAIDGKRCVIQAPPNTGTLYRNYKQSFSVVLLAVCDAFYNFTYVNIGAYGSESDGGILRRSDFGQALLHGGLDFPEDDYLPESQEKFPYFLVGDEAFPLKANIMRPYGGNRLSASMEYFNARLSSARRYIENTFGILASKFRIYHRTIIASESLAQSIVKCTVALHNFIRKTGSQSCNSNDLYQFEQERQDDRRQGQWQDEPAAFNHSGNAPLQMRDILKDFLSGVGGH